MWKRKGGWTLEKNRTNKNNHSHYLDDKYHEQMHCNEIVKHTTVHEGGELRYYFSNFSSIDEFTFRVLTEQGKAKML